MERKFTLLLLMTLYLLTISGLGRSQNFFIEITDKETYKPVPEVRLDLHSPQRNLTFYSSVDGFINESVPAGTYTLELSREGYQELVVENVQIRAFDVSRYSFKMNALPKVIVTEDDTLKKNDDIVIIDKDTINNVAERRPRNLVFELGQQFGNIQGTGIGVGYFFYRDVFLLASLHTGRQSYQSLFFKDPTEAYKLRFSSLSTMLGYEYTYPFKKNPGMGLTLTPSVSLGMEGVYNSDFIDNSRVFLLMNPALNPALDVGFYYSIAAVFIRIDYIQWLGDAMNQERNVLENGITGQSMRWGNDLFHEREGFSLQLGVKAYLNYKKRR